MEDEYRLLAELNDNNMIPLDDGSKWEVAPENVPIASTWLPTSRVTVRLVDEGSEYQYKITRILDQDSIRAKKVTSGHPHRPRRRDNVG